MAKKHLRKRVNRQASTDKLFSKTLKFDNLFNLMTVLLIVVSLTSVGLAYFYQSAYQKERDKINRFVSSPKLGQISDCKSVSLSVVGARQDLEGIVKVWPANPDQKFVMVRMMLLNKSDLTYHLSPVTSAKLVGGDMSKYEVSSAPNINEPLGGPLESWKSAVGEIGFTVPKEQNNFVFEYDLGQFEAECKVQVKIEL